MKCVRELKKGTLMLRPQHVQELATSLPRYPKELSLTLIKMKGKDNTFKDVSVRRHMVQNALTWLINNNPHYQDVHLNQQCLEPKMVYQMT